MENYKGKFIIIPAFVGFKNWDIVDNSDYSLFSDSSFNDYVHRVIDCDLYEAVNIVLPSGDKYVMLVDESGLLKNKPINNIAWYLYSRFHPQAPVVGDVLICKLCYADFGEGFPEHDFCCLDDLDISRLKRVIG